MELPVSGPYLDLLRRGDTYAAIRGLRRAEAAQPRHGETVLLLAYAYYLAGQKKLFVQKAVLAAELLPGSPDPPYALGRYYLDGVQRRDLAEEQFRLALARGPAHAGALYHLGWCLEQDGDAEAAARHYTRANTWLGDLGLARLALAAGDTKRSLERAMSAARRQPGSPLVYLLIAKIHQRDNDCAGAIPAIRRAVALDPSDASAYYQLSRCAAATGDAPLHRQSLQQYERLRTIYAP